MKHILFVLLIATGSLNSMQNDLPALKKQAEALATKLREQSYNTARESRGSYKSFEQQQLEQLRLQIRAYEHVETQ